MTDECLVDEQAQLKLNPLLDRQPVQVDCIGQVIPSVHSRVRPVKKLASATPKSTSFRDIGEPRISPKE